MNDGPDDPSLIALGAAVSDGAVIDWLAAEHLAEDADRQSLVRGMRDVAALIAAHRQVISAPPPVTPRTWRHLVLCEALGDGAFGTVYRAWDQQLERDVALKLLHKAEISSVSPLAEARHLARIRHANIVVVYGADREDGQVGIWMEYIAGHTLAAMIRDAGPMSAREATGVGIDLCRALSALHGAGLLHRDIKAHNVLREVGGRIVLMDFSGVQERTPDRDREVISGTPLYMAPELFEGGGATAASDVYSLGVLLFFLLTGSVPVDGSTMAEVRERHAAGTRQRLRDLRADLPETIVQVIECATAHDIGSRYQTAGELEEALAAAAGTHVQPAGDDGSARRGTTWLRRAAVCALGAVALAAITAGVARVFDSPPAPLTVRFSIGPPYTTGSWPRLSPDGRLVVFGTQLEGQSRFWIRPLDSAEGRPLKSTTATETPFWSPDGRVLAFFADGKLKKIPVDGGEPEILTDAIQPHGGDWRGDRLLFATQAGVVIVDADGSHRRAVTTLDRSAGEFQHAWPRFLPDGRRFLYMIRSSRPERSGTYVGSLDGGAPWRLMDAYSRVTYTSSYLFYVRDGTLLAQPFDAGRPALTGSPVALSGRVKYHREGDAAFDVSASGVLISYFESGQPTTKLALFDRSGVERQTLAEAAAYRQPRFSPDGQRVVAEKASTTDGNVDLWIYEVERQSAVKLSRTAAVHVNPFWSPDGRRVVFSSRRGAAYQLFSKTVDGTGDEQALDGVPNDALVEDWSRDGAYFSATIPRSGLWIVPAASGQRPLLVRASARANLWQSEFSPDGKWIAYMNEESGSPEVFVEPFPATGDRWQLSTRGGAEPHWRGDGKELFYIGGDGMLMSVDVAARSWQTSKPRALFAMPVFDVAGYRDFDVSADGQTFVVNVLIARPVVPPIDVVVNWPSLLAK
jgi:Tol biopolymer transport system component